jgi:hypothetical protein
MDGSAWLSTEPCPFQIIDEYRKLFRMKNK